MRGFIHVVEIVVTMMLIFVALSQFSNFYVKDMAWSANYLYLIGKDLLYTLGDMDFYNSTTVRERLSILKSRNIEYEMKLSNAMKSTVVVGCDCTDQEANAIRGNLSSFFANNREITFSVFKMTDVDNWNDLDVIVYPQVKNLDSSKAALMNFLDAGKGVIEIGAVGAHASEDVQKTVFNLKTRTESIPLGDINITFNKTSANKPSYLIVKYFNSLPAVVKMKRDLDVGGARSCTNSTYTGNMTFRSLNFTVFIIDEENSCSSSLTPEVFVDKDMNYRLSAGEVGYKEGENFTVIGYNFTVKKIWWSNNQNWTEAEQGVGAWIAYPSLCTGAGDYVCSSSMSYGTDVKETSTSFPVFFEKPDWYEIWMRSYRGDSNDKYKNDYYVYVDDNDATKQSVEPYKGFGVWSWNKTLFYVPTAGYHTIKLVSPYADQSHNQWVKSVVDAFFIRNTTFSASNRIEITFNENYSFQNFLPPAEKLYPNDNSIDKILLSQGQKYDNPGRDSVPASIINYAFTPNFRGRALWIESLLPGNDFEVFLKSAVVWAAGGDVVVINNPPLSQGVTVGKFVSESKDVPVVYQVLLTLWQV
ncbi:MAG: hypothetical protein V1731_00365 [Candidatus Aenigmatarchaeota archaeon]